MCAQHEEMAFILRLSSCFLWLKTILSRKEIIINYCSKGHNMENRKLAIFSTSAIFPLKFDQSMNSRCLEPLSAWSLFKVCSGSLLPAVLQPLSLEGIESVGRWEERGRNEGRGSFLEEVASKPNTTGFADWQGADRSGAGGAG